MPRGATYAGFIRSTPLRYAASATDLSGTTAITVVGPFTPGYTGELEEFGCIVGTALTGGPQVYTLRDAADTVLATLTVPATTAKGTQVKTRAFTEATRQVLDGTTLTIKRTTSGTAITGGALEFYVSMRQRLQART